MTVYKRDKEQFLDQLTRNLEELTEEERQLAEYLKLHYKKVCYMSIDELVSEISIDVEIICRYLQKIGFKNYEDFRKSLRKTITVELSSSERFQIFMEIYPNVHNILHHVVNKEIQNLNHLIHSFDKDNFLKVIEAIHHAPEIIAVGTRASAPIAIYAEETFNRIGKKAGKIISGGTENFNFLSTVDRNALILVFGFARYPKETIKILNFFKKRNFKIISLTDDLYSPLVPFSDIVLTVPCESVSFTDFIATPMAIVNTLVIAISQIDKEKSFKYLNEFENIAKDMGFYF